MNEWRRPRQMGEVIFGAWRVYEGNFLQLFLIALVTAPLQLLSVIVQRSASEDVAAGVSFLLLIPTVIVSLVATGALVHAVHGYTGGEPVEAGRSLDAGLARFWSLFTTGFLAGMGTVLALFAFPFLLFFWLGGGRIDGRRDWYHLVPFVLPFYLAIRWSFYPQAVVIEGMRNWGALDVSADNVRRNWWRVLGISIVIGLAQIGPFLLVGAAAFAPPLIEGTVSALVAALVLPFSVAAQTLLFYDLKARKSLEFGPPAITASEPDVQGEGPRDL